MSSELLWALSRASGLVLLPLFTLVVVLGVLTRGGRRLGRSPRWVTPLVHRSLALAALGFLVVHVGSVVADGYVDVSLLDVVVPFASGYRPFWTGLGTVAVLLLVAVVATSLARVRLGRRVWRAVHALTWPFLAVSLAHALGVGSDTRTPWGLALAAACVVAVLAALAVGRRRDRWRPADPVHRPSVLQGSPR
ncbi:ferric reductase-like transmembrane domain-containing protein [Kineococcus endophyticus]|uniref:Ferric reductase-like transmembrane domain-containing protein n=1 Tax=Kineococcus endophyticus TaxID=1181883 RepID=A0ABV3P975_9ACTN